MRRRLACPRLTRVPAKSAWGVVAALLGGPLWAQELQPRALQNAPVGTNFLLLAGGYSRGNLLFDAALPLKDVTADVWAVTPGYVRAIDVFGRSGQVGVFAPFATGQWEAVYAGIDTAASRTGFGDPRVQVAVNFLGAPALTASQMRAHRSTTVAGMQLALGVPLGQYHREKLINLGSHRWSFQPRLGVSHALGASVTLEGYVAATVFTTNRRLYGSHVLRQDPFYEAQVHAIVVTRNPGLWFAGSFGYGWGGAITLDTASGDRLGNTRASALARLPLAPGHSVKLVYINAITTRSGADFDTFQVAYQYAYGGRR